MPNFQLAVRDAATKPVITFHINPDVSDGEIDVIADVNGDRFLVLSFLENEEGKIGFHTYYIESNAQQYFAKAPNGKLSYAK